MISVHNSVQELLEFLADFILTFVLVSFTAYIAFQIVKVEVTPWARAVINQFDACAFIFKSFDIPGLTSHRFSAATSVFSDKLENEKIYIKSYR